MSKATTELKEALNHVKEAEIILTKLLKDGPKSLGEVFGDDLQDMIYYLNSISDDFMRFYLLKICFCSPCFMCRSCVLWFTG